MKYHYHQINGIESIFNKSLIINESTVKNLITNTTHELPNIERVLTYGDFIVMIDVHGFGYLLNNQLSKIYNHEFKVDGFKNDFILFYDLNNENLNGVYSISNDEVLFTTNENIGRDIHGETIFELDQNYITARNIRNGNKLWTWELKNLFIDERFKKGLKFENIEIEKIIGQYNVNIWIFISNGYLVALNIHSGVIDHCLGASINCSWEQECLSNGGHAITNFNYKIDPNNHKMILIDGIDYFQIDLSSLSPNKEWIELTTKGIKCDMKGNNDGFQFDENYLYFYDKVKSTVAVMERESLQVVWSHEIKVEVKKGEFILGLLSNLQIYKDAIYVLDRNSSLHIFEKETQQA